LQPLPLPLPLLLPSCVHLLALIRLRSLRAHFLFCWWYHQHL
jgi:hypothetical protein